VKLANNVNKTIIADAVRITTILNKHLREDCPHCREFLEEVFNDD